MKIGIIGMGMVGEAVAFGLKRIGHEIIGYDLNSAKGTGPLKDVLGTELVFVCVPTPTVNDTCEIGAVWEVVGRLKTYEYKGLVVIKSTVPPGTTEMLANNTGLNLAFCPEFLRERARFSDFYENHEVCIVGVDARRSAEFWCAQRDLIFEAHGSIPKSFKVMYLTEAELAKYFVNCFNAYRINFANAFFDVCRHLGADYTVIKDAVTHRTDTKSSYLDANENFRAFGGACLPKDTQAFAAFVQKQGLLTHLFENIVDENKRVESGMTMFGELVKAARSA